ncbi:MAG: sialidase [Gemmatimonadota bacterium]|nr:MAG: sialidase [Gemmatimonadota bacterium]
MARPAGRRFGSAGIVLAIFSLTLALPGVGFAQQISPERYEQIRYRHIGPEGNRTVAVAGIPGDRTIYYVGAASGGIWKTVDAGLNWEPIFDDQDVHAIGALAVAPSDQQIVWAGTGEPFIRSNVSIGNGVYKSTDGGATWEHRGLDNTGRIARILIHPGNPDIVYAAAVGHGYSPQQDRGVYRTRDGGATWQRVLFVDENTGASDLVMAPNNPRILFAGMWQIDIKTWGRESGGPGSGLHVSRDGGDSWTRLEGHGLPKLPVGKIALCMTPEDPNRIYALIETGDGVPWHGEPTESGELWRSDDGGENWQLVTHDRDLAGRQPYYTRCAVAPDDPDEAYFLAASYSVTKDGGRTSELIGFDELNAVPGYDHHDMWIDPTNADRMIVAHDGGVSISENRGRSWLRVQLPVAQMYHVTVDNNIPYYVYGNRQDGPSVRGPSNSRIGGFFSMIPRGMWHSVGGGESGFATPDPVDPNIIWSSASGAGARGGIVVRYDERTRQYRDVEVWPESTGGWPAEGLRYRFQWTFPLLISPHDNNTVYVTSQHVHRTTNGGQSWEVVSPDLTTNDTTKMGISGGLTPDNIGVEYCCVIYAFDESPVQQGVFWAGSNDGLVHVSRDGGATWTDVTRHIPDLPPLGVVRNIDASKWDAGKAYITVDFHQVGNFDPYVYKTEDFGRHWTRITDGIPRGPLSYARNIREDPVRPGLLYLGTENALYVSFDDGDNWQPLRMNLPPAPMYWIVVQEHFNDLVVGTYGRGFWILDDVTPLQQLTPEVAGSDAHLFEPRQAYRFQDITEPMVFWTDPSAGENPPYGASINYWLGSAPEADVKIHIFDTAGDTVRTLDGTKEVGINRIWWDLRYEPTEVIKLRTKPLHADWVDLGEERWRAAPVGRIRVLAPPGTYTVTLEVDGREYTRQLDVIKDPNSEGTEADIRAQTAMLMELRDDMNAASELINRIEWIRRQLYDLRAVLEDKGDLDEVVEAADDIDAKLIGVEENLIQLRLTGTGQDRIRWPTMLAGRIAYLAGAVEVGDFPPTDQAREVHTLLKERLQSNQQAVEEVLDTDLSAFNRMLGEQDLGAVVAELD